MLNDLFFGRAREASEVLLANGTQIGVMKKLLWIRRPRESCVMCIYCFRARPKWSCI